MKAYYFSNNEKTLRYGDARKIQEGITHSIEFPFKDCDGKTWDAPTLCSAGLHASTRAIDALKYAPGPWLWLVELSGDIVEGPDKVVASSRTYIKGFDATLLLQEFTRYCAGLNVELIMPYCNCVEDYNIILEFLETGKNASAAYNASRSAAYYAANAAYDAVYYAAYAANAADIAAYAAAYAAYAAADAYYASRSAAHYADANISFEDYKSELNLVLEQMIEKYFINN